MTTELITTRIPKTQERTDCCEELKIKVSSLEAGIQTKFTFLEESDQEHLKRVEENLAKTIDAQLEKGFQSKLIGFQQTEHTRLKRLEEDLARSINTQVENARSMLEGELRQNFLHILERKLHDESNREDGNEQIRATFFPLIDVTIEQVIEELDFRGQFEKILSKELEDKKYFTKLLIKELKEEKRFESILGDLTKRYLNLNQKVSALSNIVEEMRQKTVSTKDELREQVDNIMSRLEENSKLAVSIHEKLYEIERNRDITTEQIQQSYRDIIEIIEGEKDIIDPDGMVRVFEPLVKSLIETELDEKGRFVQLLAEKISEISSEKASAEFQKHFRTLVDSIVGKGTKKNEKMARENTELGLRRMSEADVDEILGKKIIKIVNTSSGLGEAIANVGESLNESLNKLRSGMPEDNKVKQFFDGLSLSVYYFECIKADSIIFLDKDQYPQDIDNFIAYIKPFKNIIEEEEQAYRKSPESYANYSKTTPKTVTIDTNEEGIEKNSLEAYLYMSYLDDCRIYFFCSQEPSALFKKKAKELLKYDDFQVLKTTANDLVKTYTIPKVNIAVFNSKGFELPSDEGLSVISIKDGNKYLEREEEIELLTVLKELNENDSCKKPMSFFKKLTSNAAQRRKECYQEGCHGLWHFWAESYPTRKYLAVKMAEEFGKGKEDIKKNFQNYVQEQIWEKLISSKSIKEMQEWVDTFIQKDAGLLAQEATGIFTFLKYLKYATVLSIITFCIMAYFYWLPNLEKELQLQNIKIIEESENHDENLYLVKQSTEEQDQILTTEVKNSENVLSLVLNKMLADDTDMYFEFNPQKVLNKIKIQDLPLSDLARLKRIAHYFTDLEATKLSPSKWNLEIVMYDNIHRNDKEHNRRRANLVKSFLEDENSNLKGSIYIRDVIDKSAQTFGVKLIPIKTD
ncbi:hypothetical protein [Candidatus Albibeggiatoa sp. nov. NOAA]|uniref:hypothetical protein n=1 Tax=Candidatus Albibeggiatoa sp. nov. NOAA TaxID=3162724 RepID=UPI0032F8E497|nr:hypothetical protein [Thiotrichaceae bacterium]